MEKGEDATTWGWGATASKEEKKNPCVCYSPPSGQSVKSSTIIAFKAREEASQSWKKIVNTTSFSHYIQNYESNNKWLVVETDTGCF